MGAGSDELASITMLYFMRVVFFQGLDDLGDGGTLLPDGDIDTNHIAAALVQDGVHRHGGFARLAVADDQFALAASDGDHGVDGLESRLQRLAHGLAIHHARGDALDGAILVGEDGSFAVGGAAQRIHDAAHQGVAHRHRHDAIGALDDVAFLDLGVVPNSTALTWSSSRFSANPATS